MRHWIAALTLYCVINVAQSAQSPAVDTPSSKDTLVYIGTYTHRLPEDRAEASSLGKGIYFFRVQSAGTEVFQNVTLVPLGLAAEAPNPSFFELDTKRPLLFTVNEIETFEGKPTGAVSSYAIDASPSMQIRAHSRSSRSRALVEKHRVSSGSSPRRSISRFPTRIQTPCSPRGLTKAMAG